MRRCPVIVRVDGKGFSRWTKKMKFEKPFDTTLVSAMSIAMLATAEEIEGCVFGYTQSDEMTFVLRNDQSLESEPWFGNRIQKICSVVSSMVTANFTKIWETGLLQVPGSNLDALPISYFDARVFTVPTLDEAANALIWRQNDATKNSISAACYYEVAKKNGKGTTRKMMHGLNGNQQQELLFQETGHNWNNYPVYLKRGSACYKEPTKIDTPEGTVMRNKWTIDQEDIPIFTQDRE